MDKIKRYIIVDRVCSEIRKILEIELPKEGNLDDMLNKVKKLVKNYNERRK